MAEMLNSQQLATPSPSQVAQATSTVTQIAKQTDMISDNALKALGIVDSIVKTAAPIVERILSKREKENAPLPQNNQSNFQAPPQNRNPSISVNVPKLAEDLRKLLTDAVTTGRIPKETTIQQVIDDESIKQFLASPSGLEYVNSYIRKYIEVFT